MIEIKRNNNIKDHILLEAKDKEEILATLEAEINKDTMIIKKISGEPFLVDGICRAALNIALSNNAYKYIFETEENLRQPLTKLGFLRQDNNSEYYINEFFENNCCNK